MGGLYLATIHAGMILRSQVRQLDFLSTAPSAQRSSWRCNGYGQSVGSDYGSMKRDPQVIDESQACVPGSSAIGKEPGGGVDAGLCCRVSASPASHGCIRGILRLSHGKHGRPLSFAAKLNATQ